MRFASFRIVMFAALIFSMSTVSHVLALSTVRKASQNAWVKSGAGNQDESSTMRVENTANLAYLRFNTMGLSVSSNDLVYLDLYCSFEASQDPAQLRVAALVDGTTGETTWDSDLTYATRPDGTSGPTNASTTAVVTYKGRVLMENSQNPPGQIAILIDSSTFQALLDSDSNNELTLILYGAVGYIDVASLGSGNFEPQLRIIRHGGVVTIPESIYGGQYYSSTWTWTNTVAHIGQGSGANQQYKQYSVFLLFQLPERPPLGFKPSDTSLGITLQQTLNSPSSFPDIWAIGYFPSNYPPLVANDVSGFHLASVDSETKIGLNIGTNNTEKIANNLMSRYASAGARYGIAPDACSKLAAFINDLFQNHGASAGDYLMLRINSDALSGTSAGYYFYMGNAASALKPVLTLSPNLPLGSVLVIR